MNMNRENKLQELTSGLVQREVYYCVSSLISTLVNLATDCNTNELDYDELVSLCRVDDWESPVNDFIQNDAGLEQLEWIAENCGYWDEVLDTAKVPTIEHRKNDTEDFYFAGCNQDFDDEHDAQTAAIESVLPAIRDAVYKLVTSPEQYEKIGREFNLDPYEREAYEHWIVSEWAARWLKEAGEVVGEVCGLTIWGRTCTGQAISMDGVWREKAARMWADELNAVDEEQPK